MMQAVQVFGGRWTRISAAAAALLWIPAACRAPGQTEYFTVCERGVDAALQASVTATNATVNSAAQCRRACVIRRHRKE